MTLIISILIISILYPFIEARNIKIRYEKVKNSKIPKEFVDKRIVFISDIHYGKIFSKKRLHKIIKSINKLQPDLVLLGGDFITEDTSNRKDILNKKYISECIEELKGLNSKLGIYAVLGNHDHKGNLEYTKELLKINNIKLLNNDIANVIINKSIIRIAGVEDFIKGKPSLNNIKQSLSENIFSILLSHNPDYVENLDTKNIDYILSGHTHGGQLNFFGLYAPYTASKYGQKYIKEKIFLDNNCVLIISKGLGNGIIPARFFSRPDFLVLELQN